MYPLTLICTDRKGIRLDSAVVNDAEERQKVYDKWKEVYKEPNGADPYIFVE